MTGWVYARLAPCWNLRRKRAKPGPYRDPRGPVPDARDPGPGGGPKPVEHPQRSRPTGAEGPPTTLSQGRKKLAPQVVEVFFLTEPWRLLGSLGSHLSPPLPVGSSLRFVGHDLHFGASKMHRVPAAGSTLVTGSRLLENPGHGALTPQGESLPGPYRPNAILPLGSWGRAGRLSSRLRWPFGPSFQSHLVPCEHARTPRRPHHSATVTRDERRLPGRDVRCLRVRVWELLG